MGAYFAYVTEEKRKFDEVERSGFFILKKVSFKRHAKKPNKRDEDSSVVPLCLTI